MSIGFTYLLNSVLLKYLIVYDSLRYRAICEQLFMHYWNTAEISMWGSVWRRDGDVLQKLLTDGAQGSRWTEGCGGWAEAWRRGEGERRGERVWLSRGATASLQILFCLFMSSRRFSLFFPLLPRLAPLPSLLFSALWLLVGDSVPAPFLPFDFGSASSSLLWSPWAAH